MVPKVVRMVLLVGKVGLAAPGHAMDHGVVQGVGELLGAKVEIIEGSRSSSVCGEWGLGAKWSAIV